MSTSYDEARVRAAFDFMMIGSVTRVDFASITPGAYPSSDAKYQKAFVHMSMLYDTDSGNHLRESLKTTKDSVRIYPEQFNRDVYWIVLLNKTPVAETNLNIHQVVENHRILEQVVFQQAATIRTLEARLEQLIKYSNFPQELEDELLGVDHMPELISMEDLNSSA